MQTDMSKSNFTGLDSEELEMCEGLAECMPGALCSL